MWTRLTEAFQKSKESTGPWKKSDGGPREFCSLARQPAHWTRKNTYNYIISVVVTIVGTPTRLFSARVEFPHASDHADSLNRCQLRAGPKTGSCDTGCIAISRNFVKNEADVSHFRTCAENGVSPKTARAGQEGRNVAEGMDARERPRQVLGPILRDSPEKGKGVFAICLR